MRISFRKRLANAQQCGVIRNSYRYFTTDAIIKKPAGMGSERQGRLDGDSQLESTFWFCMAIIMGSSGVRSGACYLLFRSNRVHLGRNCRWKGNTNNGSSKALGSSNQSRWQPNKRNGRQVWTKNARSLVGYVLCRWCHSYIRGTRYHEPISVDVVIWYCVQGPSQLPYLEPVYVSSACTDDCRK